MTSSSTFLGEVAIFQAVKPETDFGAFEEIPNLSAVNQLAGEFAEYLELMPYQELGDPLAINLSIYLRPVFGEGRVIAIVAREAFPADYESLSQIIQKGIRHLDLLAEGIGFRFEESSIESAAKQLRLLLSRVDELKIQ